MTAVESSNSARKYFDISEQILDLIEIASLPL